MAGQKTTLAGVSNFQLPTASKAMSQVHGHAATQATATAMRLMRSHQVHEQHDLTPEELALMLRDLRKETAACRSFTVPSGLQSIPSGTSDDSEEEDLVSSESATQDSLLRKAVGNVKSEPGCTGPRRTSLEMTTYTMTIDNTAVNTLPAIMCTSPQTTDCSPLLSPVGDTSGRRVRRVSVVMPAGSGMSSGPCSPCGPSSPLLPSVVSRPSGGLTRQEDPAARLQRRSFQDPPQASQPQQPPAPHVEVAAVAPGGRQRRLSLPAYLFNKDMYKRGHEAGICSLEEEADMHGTCRETEAAESPVGEAGLSSARPGLPSTPAKHGRRRASMAMDYDSKGNAGSHLPSSSVGRGTSSGTMDYLALSDSPCWDEMDKPSCFSDDRAAASRCAGNGYGRAAMPGVQTAGIAGAELNLGAMSPRKHCASHGRRSSLVYGAMATGGQQSTSNDAVFDNSYGGNMVQPIPDTQLGSSPPLQQCPASPAVLEAASSGHSRTGDILGSMLTQLDSHDRQLGMLRKKSLVDYKANHCRAPEGPAGAAATAAGPAGGAVESGWHHSYSHANYRQHNTNKTQSSSYAFSELKHAHLTKQVAKQNM